MPVRVQLDRRAADGNRAQIPSFEQYRKSWPYDDLSELLSTEGLAERIRTSVWSLEEHRRNGTGPPVTRISPRRVRYQWGAVLWWLYQVTYNQPPTNGGKHDPR